VIGLREINNLGEHKTNFGVEMRGAAINQRIEFEISTMVKEAESEEGEEGRWC